MSISSRNSRLNTEAEKSRRRALLSEPHMRSLRDYVRDLHTKIEGDPHIPNFDPCDGGIDARVLFLLAAAQSQVQSGFISHDNPDQTASNFGGLLAEAGINRKETIVWNVVPWRVEKPIDDADVVTSLPYLKDLLKLLPHLEVIVLVSQSAWLAEPYIKTISRVNIKKTWMPSPMSVNRHKKRPEILKVFQEVAAILNR